MRSKSGYAIAIIAVCVAVSIFVAAVASQLVLVPDYGRPRPTPAVLVPYKLAYVGPSGAGEMTVDPDGAACTKFNSSEFLLRACTLALELDPRFIAGEDFDGELNTRDTPVYEAIVWRALLEGNPDLCDRGGLLDDRLASCRAIASSSSPHTASGGGWQVTITRP